MPLGTDVLETGRSRFAGIAAEKLGHFLFE
jgi:hypothetical protein